MSKYLIKTIKLPDDAKGGDWIIDSNWMFIDPDKINEITIFDKIYVHPVYCKDCKYYKQLDSACPYLGEDGYYKELPGKDDFCSRGERKE